MDARGAAEGRCSCQTGPATGGAGCGLADGDTVPAGACNTWTALWHAPADLERSLHEHIHLENNVRFPRAPGTTAQPAS